jgi:hypothetical protein
MMQLDPMPLDPGVLKAANINPVTGLATDYLNHYNEAAMLVGMLADMPDMAETVLEWTPISYADHFHVTGFRERDLAIAAHQQASPEVLMRFDAACEDVHAAIFSVQDFLRAHPESAAEAAPRVEELFELIARVGGVINASLDAAPSDDAQADIDSLFA